MRSCARWILNDKVKILCKLIWLLVQHVVFEAGPTSARQAGVCLRMPTIVSLELEQAAGSYLS